MMSMAAKYMSWRMEVGNGDHSDAADATNPIQAFFCPPQHLIISYLSLPKRGKMLKIIITGVD